MSLTFGSLFAGIGGFDLGFERAGMECRWQVEIDPYCQQVLRKHWPKVFKWDDVKTFPPHLSTDYSVDIICGGFPCKEVSVANQYEHAAKGIDGPQSGLWDQFRRIICEMGPRFVLLENSPAITLRGLDRILGQLARLRYDAEWARIPAGLFGASHRRDRVFVFAWQTGSGEWGMLPNGDRTIYRGGCIPERRQRGCGDARRFHGLLSSGVADLVADANIARREGHISGELADKQPNPRYLTRLYGDDSRNPFIGLRCKSTDICRKRDGVPFWMDRLRGLGNAVVPHVAEWIGKRIITIVECNLDGQLGRT